MYSLIGSFVRTGNQSTDPLHSTVVFERGDMVLSMNKTGRGPLRLHCWHRLETGPNSPDTLQAFFSVNYRDLELQYRLGLPKHRASGPQCPICFGFDSHSDTCPKRFSNKKGSKTNG